MSIDPSTSRPTRRFRAPAGFSPSPTQPFQVALTMAGAVSGGAYTAGVLDFWVEALDAWRAQVAAEAHLRPEERTVPWHSLQLRALSGASAGSMCGAILAVALHRSFPPVRATSSPVDREANPFYRAWVKRIGILGLLGTRDLDDGGPPRSILDCTPLQDILDEVMDPAGTTARPLPREWVHPDLRFRFAITNLDPIPLGTTMAGLGATGHNMWFHQAHAAFQLSSAVPATHAPGLPTPLNIHCLRTPGDPRRDAGWNAFGQAALASGGFPFFLCSRALEVDLRASLEAVLPRVLRVTGRPGTLRLSAGPPAGVRTVCHGPTRILAVDGGALNNEPLELARRDLLGPTQLRNPRTGSRASAAVVMVAPFPNPEGSTTHLSPTLPFLGLIGPFLAAWAHHARFRPEEFALAAQETSKSRFILAPMRTGGQDARLERGPLAAGALGAFMGFFCETYRHHDYLLGRRNAQQFLKAHFNLPASNPLFAGMEHLHPRRGTPDCPCTLELPLVPLVGPCAVEEPLPPWPKGAFDPEDLRDDLKRRMRAVMLGIADSGNSWLHAMLRFFRRPLAWCLAGKVIDILRKAQREADL